MHRLISFRSNNLSKRDGYVEQGVHLYFKPPRHRLDPQKIKRHDGHRGFVYGTKDNTVGCIC